MENNLSTQRKISVLTTYDGAVFYLDEKQDRALQSLGKGDKIDIEGSLVFYGNIKGIYSVSQWQIMNPVEHSSSERELPKYEIQSYTKEKYLKCLKKMIEAFKGHFEGRKIPDNSQKILTKLIEKYNRIEQEPEDKKFNNPALDFIKL